MSCPSDGDKLLSLDMRNFPSCVGTRIHKVVVSSHRFLSERFSGFELHRNGICEVFQTLQSPIKDTDDPFEPLLLSGSWCGLRGGRC